MADAVRRVAHRETAHALDRLSNLEGAQAAANIHDCRKRCKKVRGLIRLVRPALDRQYRAVDRTFRDAARELSPYRDAQALLATFDRLVDRSPDDLPAGGLGPVRAQLVERAQAATQAVADDADPIGRARHLLTGARAGIDTWALDHRGWEAAAEGAATTYGQGVQALAAAKHKPTPHRYHELRKRTKYSWYHVSLLQDAAPARLGSLDRKFGKLSDTLGDAHDLAVLRNQLVAEPDAFGGPKMVETAGVFLDRHRFRLERKSTALATRLYAEEPKIFVDRLALSAVAYVETTNR